ncbi:3-oxoacyl-ACP synthase III family protein [Deinococcus cellulosilyticus]|uniref:3-oxoacyl-ACP synthase n=1 Tax=Deinococcus cellulosilyticus (strain DSM 18568 / NBRC 106333 / KACC 11606 / 5516J-15) TaxID=1223518 RepID=A0A511N437_DEIC1|nr:ketoacyl-ACP synthase III [Deinococcus cellulosilyticus]GEM47602.1 3-oxoacyl-ACP synthase [Deinococcus cellulosilyticus NBRC 106333 = KACC 11606]
MPTYAYIHDIAYYLPEKVLDNAALSQEFPEWSVQKISSKTGIDRRHIAAPDEFASDMAVQAAERLFERYDRQKIDYVLLCTQSPDYFLPTTACIVQERLGLRTDIGALDFNLGCSGYVYGLGLAKSLIETGQASNVLLLTSEAYSKFIHPADKSVRTIFGDAASATVICGTEAESPFLSDFRYGSDGSGYKNLIVPNGGLRGQASADEKFSPQKRNLSSNGYDLFMDGPEIFNFTLRVVPETISKVLNSTAKNLEDIDLFVFHQANRYMMEHLRNKLGIPSEKFAVYLEECGNTVSSTIPITLHHAKETGQLQNDMNLMLVGFGVGLSWGGCMVRWRS